MIQERQAQEKRVCWSLKLWSIALISIILLSACFIVSCVVTYHFASNKYDKRLSVLHTYHSNLICFSEGTMVTDSGTKMSPIFLQSSVLQ
uniref:C-type lectin domain containing 6A n=1 Tax=Marmota marmota marmota TaxID=9994 RepID=A0A8C5ZKL7_MARMA